MNTEIKLVQNPIIEHKLREIGESVSKRIDDLNIENQVPSEDTIPALKKMRAELNGEAKAFEERRKSIKNSILTPYQDFEAIYKIEIIDKYTNADNILKTKISDFEMKIKVEKRNNLETYFKELVEHEEINWLTFDRWNVEINLSTTEKKYKENILEFVAKIVSDIDLINTEEHAAEILVEFKKTLNSSQAITEVRRRKEQEKLERERLINQRTNSRISQLRKISFVYSDIANAYYFVRDDKVSIPMKDIETLENDEWNKRFVSFEAEVAKYNPKEEKTEVLQKPTVVSKATEQPKEEIHQAKFLVQGTMSQLMKLKEFLVTNNYQYTNIQ